MKKIMIIVLCVVLVLFAFTLFTGYTLVIPFSKSREMKNLDCQNGIINPLKDYDFSTGDWEMYIVLSDADRKNLSTNIQKVNCFKTSNKDVLETLQQSWNFECRGSDMATVDSDLYLLRNGKMVFSSGLMLNEKQEGLQSQSFGWIFSKDYIISKSLREFNRVYMPIILL